MYIIRVKFNKRIQTLIFSIGISTIRYSLLKRYTFFFSHENTYNTWFITIIVD